MATRLPTLRKLARHAGFADVVSSQPVYVAVVDSHLGGVLKLEIINPSPNGFKRFAQVPDCLVGMGPLPVRADVDAHRGKVGGLVGLQSKPVRMVT